MRLTATLAAIFLSIVPALADEQKPSLPQQIDTSKTITLTLAELQALILAERAQVTAAAVMAKVATAFDAAKVSKDIK